jgi:hypothetical protein
VLGAPCLNALDVADRLLADLVHARREAKQAREQAEGTI